MAAGDGFTLGGPEAVEKLCWSLTHAWYRRTSVIETSNTHSPKWQTFQYFHNPHQTSEASWSAARRTPSFFDTERGFVDFSNIFASGRTFSDLNGSEREFGALQLFEGAKILTPCLRWSQKADFREPSTPFWIPKQPSSRATIHGSRFIQQATVLHDVRRKFRHFWSFRAAIANTRSAKTPLTESCYCAIVPNGHLVTFVRLSLSKLG